MDNNIYVNGEYLSRNPQYHVQDSLWKAQQILKMVKKHNLEFKSVCEIGCGAGEILYQLQLNLPSQIRYYGYDISPQAIELCKIHANGYLDFYCEDLLSKSIEPFDFLLCIDVLEHVDDYIGFLKKLKQKAKLIIFHIPLDISLQSVFRGFPIVQSRVQLGHLHYFTKDTAILTLSYAGYEIIDFFYTPVALDLGNSLLVKLTRLPIKIISMINQDISERVFGAYALMVLAK
jgi:2-polyprenyl-3-methyl-5-hydroxy-6-metoxy-1,4-benzoquinol methylase